MKPFLFTLMLSLSFDVLAIDTNSTNEPAKKDQKGSGGVTLPDGTFIPNSPKKNADQSTTKTTLSLGGVIQDGSSKDTYDYLKGLYERQKTLIAYLPDQERLIYHDSINLLDAYFKAYEEGNSEAARQLFERFNEVTKDLIKNKPIVAFKYNEIFKKVISSDVRFDIYKDSDNFYLAIGEDAFRTVSTLSVDNIIGIVQAFDKAMKWSDQCFNEKLEVNKPLGTFGNVTIEFDSKEEGRFSKFIVNVKGEMSRDRLISEQTVWMSVLNFSCLIDKMCNAPEMYQKHKKAQENAGKLK
jgi:hypothetical protein